MAPRIDLTGKKFGKLTVIEFSHRNIHKQSMWKCQCDCGTVAVMSGNSLKNGTLSCFNCKTRRTSHGHRSGGNMSDEYVSWSNMIQRCTNPKHPAYSYYGGRGITVCEEWRDFKNFLKDMGERPKDLTLERIDNNKGYYPDNCKWASRYDQVRNSGNRTIITTW